MCGKMEIQEVFPTFIKPIANNFHYINGINVTQIFDSFKEIETFIPVTASFITMLYAGYKSFIPIKTAVTKIVQRGTGATQLVGKIMIHMLIKLFRLEPDYCKRVFDDEYASKIMTKIDEQVKVIETLTNREIEQLKILMDIYEKVKFNQ